MSSSSPVSSIFEIAPISHGAKFISGYAFKSSDFTDTGIPVIKIKNIQGGVVTVSGSQCVPTSLITEKIKKFETKSGDVLIAMTGQGSVGRVGRVICKKEQRLMLNQRVGRFVADEITLNIDYLYYVISSEPYEQFLFDRGAGSGQPNLSPENIMSVEIPFPDYKQQVEISTILNSLDNRIALLRETNSTLEAIAQALFKSWFVDFDPVHANAGTQAPSLPPEIQALFPATFTDSPLGLIPEGWINCEIGDYLDVLATGRRPKGGVASFSEGIPSIGAESINGIGKFDFAKTKFVPLEFFEKMKSGLVEDYDVLLYKDGGKPGEFKPRVSMFGNSFPFETFAINEHVFRMRSNYLGQAFLYFYVSHEKTLSELRNRGGKAAIPGINQTDVKTLKLLAPTKNLLDEFQTRVEPLLSTILANASLSNTFAKLRDSLLPRLISGQLRLPEAEQAIAAITD